MKGLFNQILRIDATQKAFDLRIIPEEIARKYLGGKGIASYQLLNETSPGMDPLGPDNPLIFTTGPATGSGIWGSCRHGVFTKSPQTGFYSESYSGGTVAEYMVRTGFDAFTIQGASQEPVWIEVAENTVYFHSAEELWGLPTYETEDSIRNWIKKNRPNSPKCGVTVIGPAGENLVSFAVIENDYWRSAGRTGVGDPKVTEPVSGFQGIARSIPRCSDRMKPWPATAVR